MGLVIGVFVAVPAGVLAWRIWSNGRSPSMVVDDAPLVLRSQAVRQAMVCRLANARPLHHLSPERSNDSRIRCCEFLPTWHAPSSD